MLFANSALMGTFKGFTERGLEFAAEIVAPYNASMLDKPQLGQFLLIELGSIEEASLGRVTRFVPTGLLTSSEGEDYVNTMQRRNQDVPENLKEQRLKYRVEIKLLGAVKVVDNKIVYVPSQRRLPHLGARVALPSSKVLDQLCKLSEGSTDLGDYVLGEFVHCGASVVQPDPALRSMDPELKVTFNIKNLVSRRSVVFARAGYGKSNLIKFLIAELYRTKPKTDDGKNVGTLIFDADGEYFWPDKVNKRPGLCDVPQLRNQLVLFTNRRAPSPYYGSWKVGEVRLDIRDLPPGDVISIAVSPERQTNQNVLKLKGVSQTNWPKLVDLIHQKRLQATDTEVGQLLGYQGGPQIQQAAAEIAAARSNMNAVVASLHDPNSTLLSGTLRALSQGCVVVVDISLLSSSAGNILAGLLLRKIFSHNQENFTGGQPIIPTIAILEEAQSVLGKRLEESSPFVEWVKEGRKYDLGGILVTQQPGSMAPEILSQADNWFSFHLLSEGDAKVLGHYNSHFSDDVLAHLINEPIRGNCYMWSAPKQPFVLPVRIRNFELLYSGHVSAEDSAAAVETAAVGIRTELGQAHQMLADKVKEKLKEHSVKIVDVPGAFPDDSGYGINSKQLYYVIKDAKEASHTQTEESLKMPVLVQIFGEGTVSLHTHGDKDYYCIRKVEFTAKIGQRNISQP